MYEFCIFCGDKLRYHKTYEEDKFRCLFKLLKDNNISFCVYHNFHRIYPSSA